MEPRSAVAAGNKIVGQGVPDRARDVMKLARRVSDASSLEVEVSTIICDGGGGGGPLRCREFGGHVTTTPSLRTRLQALSECCCLWGGHCQFLPRHGMISEQDAN